MIFSSDSLKRFYKTTPITFINVVAVTVMFIVTLVLGGFNNANLLRLGALFPPSIYLNGEYWRLFTVMFLHGSFTHYLFNTLFGLVIISATLERLIGPLRFGILYFASGILASVTIYVSFLVTAEATLGVGASGAIYGVLGAFLYLTFRRPQWFSPSDISSIRGLIFVNVIFTFLVPNISVGAHLGGLGAGVLLSLIIAPKTPFFKGKSQGFKSPYEPSEPVENPYQNLEDVVIIEDDGDDPEDPWGRYS